MAVFRMLVNAAMIFSSSCMFASGPLIQRPLQLSPTTREIGLADRVLCMHKMVETRDEDA
jgi:hypothetical protein